VDSPSRSFVSGAGVVACLFSTRSSLELRETGNWGEGVGRLGPLRHGEPIATRARGGRRRGWSGQMHERAKMSNLSSKSMRRSTSARASGVSSWNAISQMISWEGSLQAAAPRGDERHGNPW